MNYLWRWGKAFVMSSPENERFFAESWPLAVSSWCWHQPFYFEPTFTLFDVPAQAAAAGIHQVELNDFMLPPPRFSRVREWWRPFFPGYPAAWWHYTAGNIGRLKEGLDMAGVRCICWTLDTDLTVADREWRKQKRYIQDGVWAVKLLGADKVRLTVGGEVDAPAVIDQRVVVRLGEIAQCYPEIDFVVENHGGLTADIGRLLAIMGQLPQKNMGICFDPGNVPLEQWEEMWPQLAAVATHFHLKTHSFDKNGQERAIPYKTIFALLGQYQYEGYVIIEYEGDGLPLEGISRSQRLMGKKSEVSGYRAIAETPRGGA